jgi:hypothetical protein
MKKAYLIITVVTIIVAAVLLFTSSMRETLTNPAEYQLIIENDSIVISDYGRHVATIHLDSTGQMGIELIKDNE